MYEVKKQQNLQLLDVLACNSANKQSYRPKYPEVLYLPHA